MGNVRKWLFVISIFALVISSACSKEASVVEPSPIVEEEVEPIEPTEAPEVLAYQAPFTGVALAEEAAAAPIAVLINNLAPARPQSGLSQADVIWEVLAEGGITRLVAIFQSAATADFDIGPVRSNRPYFISLADSYGAILAHAGASNDAYAILQRQKKTYLDEISNAGPYFWRSSERKAPHNLYTNLEKLREGVEQKSYPAQINVTGYTFNKDELDLSSSTGMIKKLEVIFQMKNYRVGYQYDELTNTYKRSINDDAHIDKNNDEQLAASNLIFIQTSHKVLDDEGRLAVNMDNGGEALLITQGVATEGKWIRAEDGMIRFIKDGEELKLTSGKSFIHILPEGKAITEHVNWE